MKTKIDKHTFIKTFDDYGRSNNFSYEAREALFEYYEELEDSCDMEIEFDCIAICCDWSEYESAIEWCADYGMSDSDKESLIESCIDPEDEDEVEAAILDHIRENAQVIEFNGGILVMAF